MFRIYIITLFIIFAGLSSCRQQENSQDVFHNSKFIWDNETGTGRQVYLVFRKDFELGDSPSGKIHLFAWSRYHLNVNGVFLNFGPARSYPDSPQYDTYDISSYLKKGHNFITVEVYNNGVYTYQVPEHNGLFIAGGNAEGGGENAGFSTPGDWKVLRLQGYDKTSPKMTFATGPLESYDARKDTAEWNSAETNTAGWANAVVMSNQDQLGPFKARTIPHLTQDEYVPETCEGIYTLRNDEDIYSFRVQSSDSTRGAWNTNKIAFAWTYIYSPRNQAVNTGLWWGDYYVNGQGPLQKFTTDPDKFYRRDYTLKLHKGWNYFFVRYGIVWASWDY